MRDYKYHRALVEPAVIAGQKGTGFTSRFGYRFLYHPSDWVVGAGVKSEQGRFPADLAWARNLLAALPGAVHADILGVDAPVAT